MEEQLKVLLEVIWEKERKAEDCRKHAEKYKAAGNSQKVELFESTATEHERKAKALIAVYQQMKVLS